MNVDRSTIILTDERLDYLADRFLSRRIREILGMTFREYLRDPGWYDAILDHLEAGRALVVSDGGDTLAVVQFCGSCGRVVAEVPVSGN